MMKSIVFLLLILCVYDAAGNATAERSLQQNTASVNLVLDGPGKASANATARASTQSSIRVELLKAAREVFKTADKSFGGGKSKGSEKDFCRSAFSQLNSSAVQLLTVEVQATASSKSCVSIQGNGSGKAQSKAIAKSRAKDFTVVLRKAAVRARIGIKRSRARAVVKKSVSDFAEAFATASTSVAVDGTGTGCSESTTRAAVALQALVRTVILLVAEVDCEETFASGDIISTMEIITSNTIIDGDADNTETGTNVEITAEGEAGVTIGDGDGDEDSRK